jgi:hypothetical protein
VAVRAVPLRPPVAVDLLKNALGIRDEDSDAEVTSQVDQAVSGWAQSARGVAPYLKYILSVDPGDDAVAAMDPRECRVGVFEALRTFLLQQSSQVATFGSRGLRCR